MPFSPAIVVIAQDTPRLLLIVETKLVSRDRIKDESALKSYMLHMGCPIGLFITPKEISVYRDTYTAHSEDSIHHVATFPAPKVWAIFNAPHRGPGNPSDWNVSLEVRFEEEVRTWLDRLSSSFPEETKEIREEAKSVLMDYVLPAVSQGVVRAGGPREASVESR
jgi:hypothetical protein